MKAKWILTIRCILLIIAIAIFVVGLCLTLSPVATKMVAKSFRSKTNGNLQYSNVSGVFYGPVTFDDLSYKTDGLNIKIKKLTLETSIGSLLKKKLELDYINASDITITNTSDNNQTKRTFSKEQIQKLLQQLKYSLRIDKINFKNINYYNQKKLAAKIDKITGSLFLDSHTIDLKTKMHLLAPKDLTASFQLKGKPDDYQTKLSVDYKNFTAKAHGKGSLSGLNLQFKADKSITGIVAIEWLPELKWLADIQIDKMPIALPKSKQDLNISANIKGQGNAEQGQLKLNNLNIPANSTSINGQGCFSYSKKQPGALDLQLTAGDSKLTINGNKQQYWRVKWDADIKDLTNIWRDSTGSIASTGTIQFGKRSPVSDGQITIQNLATPMFRIGELNSKWHYALNRKDKTNIQLAVKNFLYGKVELNSASLSVDGNLIHQNGKFNIDTPAGKLSGEISGGMSLSKYWVGNFYNLEWQSKDFGTWSLKESPAIKLSKTMVDIPKTCLAASDNRSTCLSFQWKKGQDWNFTIDAKNYNLQSMAKFLNPELTVKGQANFHASLTGNKNQIQDGSIHLKMPAGSIALDNSAETYQQNYQGGEFFINIDKDGLKANGNLQINDDNNLSGTITLPGFHQLAKPAGSQKIDANINIELKDLKILSAFIPDTLKTSGSLNAKVGISGILAEPIIKGNVKLEDGTVTIPSLNIQLSNADITINGENKQLKFSGTVYSGDQPIKVSGYTHLNRPGLPTRIYIDGHNILVMNTPEYKIYATPDLILDVKHKVLWVHGDVYLPKASISPDTSFNTVTLPDDVVIVNNAGSQHKPYSWHLGIDAKVTAGDEVIYDADGIKGNVIGSLQIFKKPGGPMLANGQLKLQDGKYQSHGANLKIDQGELNFHNSPVNNPNLNVKAVRVFNSSNLIDPSINGLTVGVEITGNIKRPKTQLFSTPMQLSDADILSYILFGQAVNPSNSLTTIDGSSKKSKSDAAANIALLVQAANALTPTSEKGGNQSILGKIQKALGFEELGVENTVDVDPWKINLDNQSSIVAGKYITPKLYLRYARDLSNNEDGNPTQNNLQVRYRLNKYWAIQGSASATDNATDASNTSGYGAGADLLFSINKK